VRFVTTGVTTIEPVSARTVAISVTTYGGLVEITARSGGTGSTVGDTRETCDLTGAIVVTMWGESAASNAGDCLRPARRGSAADA
jgi:hypothetical protein